VFAALFGATPAAVKAWEQGRRNPPGPARRLLEIAERSPDVFEKDIRQAS
jgi:putative transcriptional regulator